MIYFRKTDEPRRDAGWWWSVEYYLDEHGPTFPVATAYVTAKPDTAHAQLSFILVADGWRRRGIGRQLIDACRERWPQLQFTSPMSVAGEALLRSAGVRLDPDSD